MLLIEREPGVLLLTLNRPDKRNSLHPDLLNILSAEFAQVATDPNINVVVLTGTGSSFCAGLDLQHLLNLDDAGKIAYMRQLFDLFECMYTLPQPIIAAINGPAMAGGFDLAAFCDLRLCVPTAKFAQTEILLGITQIMFPLYHTIGLTRAKELAFTGEAISAEEAQRIGFVNHVYATDNLLSEALKLADKLAARPRQTLFATKRLSRELLEANTATAFGKMFEAISERLQAEEHRQKVVEYVENLKKR
jgi:enoyl-CoA hydratase/carnithine racemase